jgi:hypothetical protein
MAFEGGCHCGKVHYTVDADMPADAFSCGCTHCRAKGLLLAFSPKSAFTLTKGDGDLAEYRFNTHKIAHQFCTNCGTESFAYGVGPDGSEMAAINLRCVPELDLSTLTVTHIEGATPL